MILHDATELDFTKHLRVAETMGQIGNGNHCGYITQNSLAVEATTGRVLGLTEQVLHHRADVPTGETLAQRRVRESRESLLWLKGIQRLPSEQKLVDVCDQGADTFEFFEHEVNSGRRFVICCAYARVVGWYEKRWIVEEYHKGKKTGCQIESTQFTTEERLQPAIALISIITLALLNMRDAS